MLPYEINLPSGTIIVEPDHNNLEKLTNDQIFFYLISTNLKDLLNTPTLIVVNDHHRSTPSSRILKILVELNVTIPEIMVATGTHGNPNKEQLEKILGRSVIDSDTKITIHSALDSNLVYIGTTSRGTDVEVNPVLFDYDQVLCINSVEAHYFAGFTGGVKSIIPGLASLKTVKQNHSWALSEKSGPTLIEENPIQLDLWEACNLLKIKKFGIQIVNFQNHIYDITYGELKSAFDSATKKSKDIYLKKISKKVDVILSIIYPPLDNSLYQAQKGIENTRQVLKSDGKMILLAKCNNGIGSNAFFNTLKKYNKPDKILKSITQENYKFGDHKVFKFASLADISKLYLISDLSLNDVENVFATSLSINDLENFLLDQKIQGKSILVALDSGSLVLVLN